MTPTTLRERCVETRPDEVWQCVPLDLAVSALTILVAAGLVLAGVMP